MPASWDYLKLQSLPLSWSSNHSQQYCRNLVCYCKYISWWYYPTELLHLHSKVFCCIALRHFGSPVCKMKKIKFPYMYIVLSKLSWCSFVDNFDTEYPIFLHHMCRPNNSSLSPLHLVTTVSYLTSNGFLVSLSNIFPHVSIYCTWRVDVDGVYHHFLLHPHDKLLHFYVLCHPSKAN